MADLTFTGQTDELITVQLPSRILYAKWRGSATSAGGTISIEVLTQWVGNSSDITVTVKDRDGNTVDTITGKVWNNLFRKEYVPAPNETQGLLFEVDMSAHGLSATSNTMRVFPSVVIENMQFLNAEDEAVLDGISDSQDVILKADIQGPPDGTKAIISLFEKYSDHEEYLIFSQATKTEAGEIRAPWTEGQRKMSEEIGSNYDISLNAETYSNPTYYFTVEAYATTEQSPEIPITRTLNLTFVEVPGYAGRFEGKNVKVTAPDGVETQHPIPADGAIIIEQSKPGLYQIDKSEVVIATGETE